MRKRGRPRLPDAERKRHNLTFRLRDVLREQLRAAAADNGRSLSEEIEWRIEQSFGTLRERRTAASMDEIEALKKALKGARIFR